jgi:hypothetical protein
VKVHYGEGVATHTGPESCALRREASREALTGVCRPGCERRRFCQHLRQVADTSRRGVRCCSFWGDEAECGARHVDQRPSGIGLSARREAIAGSAAVTTDGLIAER